MKEIAQMTRDIVRKAKSHDSDTVPGDFATLTVPCPKCGGVIKENYKKFQCQSCDFALWKIAASRQFENAEIEELLTKKVVGPLQGFRSKMGRPFAAIVKLTPELKPEFDFGQPTENADGTVQEVDFTGQEPLGKCPKCAANVYEHVMNYVCEKSVGPNKSCDFRSGKIILQQPIERVQMSKLLNERKTDLLEKFVSKRTGRAFKAFLVLGKDGKASFEFEKKKPKDPNKPGKAKEPKVKLDFTGQQPIGKCPKCGGKVFESDTDYVCEKSQSETKPCKFKTGKVILQQPVSREQVTKLLATGKTDLMVGFISKAGRPFPAYLTLDETGKVTFDFPPREESNAA
jgi:DNA topoisomerase-3